MSERGEGRIVVGVDGSPSSQSALEWAADQAERTGSPLLAVTAWAWPTSYGTPLPIPSDFDPQADAERILEEAVAPVRSAHPGITIETEATEGYTARVLVDHSEGAELLVVGSRGHGEVAGFLLGSVSEHCVSHAHCPVVVLRP